MNDANPTDFNDWIAALDESLAEAEIQAIDSQMQVLKERRAAIADAVALKRRWMPTFKVVTRTPEPATPRSFPQIQPVPDAHVATGTDGSPAPRGKQAAVLRLLSSDPNHVWETREIRDQLVRRGWMTDSPKDAASLASTLSRMSLFDGEQPRQIHRAGRGRYRLTPPPSNAMAVAAGHSVVVDNLVISNAGDP